MKTLTLYINENIYEKVKTFLQLFPAEKLSISEFYNKKLKARKENSIVQNNINFNKYFGISNLGSNTIKTQLNEMRNEWDRKLSD